MEQQQHRTNVLNSLNLKRSGREMNASPLEGGMSENLDDDSHHLNDTEGLNVINRQ